MLLLQPNFNGSPIKKNNVRLCLDSIGIEGEIEPPSAYGTAFEW